MKIILLFLALFGLTTAWPHLRSVSGMRWKENPAKIGENLTFLCEAEDTQSDSYTVGWRRGRSSTTCEKRLPEDGRFVVTHQSTDNIDIYALEIKNVTRRDTGIYCCHLSYREKYNGARASWKTVRLMVIEPDISNQNSV